MKRPYESAVAIFEEVRDEYLNNEQLANNPTMPKPENMGGTSEQ